MQYKKLVIIFFLFFIPFSIFSAGFNFINKTPFTISASVQGKRSELFHSGELFFTQTDKTVASAYILDPDMTFNVSPGKTYFYDARVAGFEKITLNFSTPFYCSISVQFQLNIPGITGIRDWILTGTTPENLSLYIGPTGLDPELGTIKGTIIKKIIPPCPKK